MSFKELCTASSKEAERVRAAIEQMRRPIWCFHMSHTCEDGPGTRSGKVSGSAITSRNDIQMWLPPSLPIVWTLS